MTTLLARSCPAPPVGTNRQPQTHFWDFPLLLLRPPYERAGGRFYATGRPYVPEVPGTILAIRLDRPCVDAHAVERLSHELSLRAPTCAVVVLLRMSPEDALLTAVRLAPLRIRAVVPEAEPLRPLLSPRLTDAAAMPAAARAWLQDHQVRLNPNTAALVEGILAAAQEHPSLGSLLAELRVPLSSARFRMRKKGLPSPSRWFQTARALHAALILQASPETSTAAIAHRLGFADHSALAHLLRRTFGIRSCAIRDTLGWEWLLERWVSRWRSEPPAHQ